MIWLRNMANLFVLFFTQMVDRKADRANKNAATLAANIAEVQIISAQASVLTDEAAHRNEEMRDDLQKVKKMRKQADALGKKKSR